MQLLRRTLIAVLLLALCRGMAALGRALFPDAGAFINPLFHSLQLLILAWLAIVIIFNLFRIDKAWHRLVPLFIVVAVLLLEGLCYYWLTHPPHIPSLLKRSFTSYYINYHRRIIQYEPSCSEYDGDLFYGLKKSSKCGFDNIEYSSAVVSNSAGVRDHDSSLMAPDIIFLGDSYTFGLGVQEGESFVDLFRAATRAKVLNTAISSFGTAREVTRLGISDTSNLKYIVIQHCRNDADENAAYIAGGGVYRAPSLSNFAHAKAKYSWARTYFPGKICLTVIFDFFRTTVREKIFPFTRPYYLSEDPGITAAHFLQVLSLAGIGELRRPVIVLDINRPEENDGKFLRAVDSLLQQPAYEPLRGYIFTEDVMAPLEEGDFFPLDGHLTPSGHRKIAEQLGKRLIVKD